LGHGHSHLLLRRGTIIIIDINCLFIQIVLILIRYCVLCSKISGNRELVRFRVRLFYDGSCFAQVDKGLKASLQLGQICLGRRYLLHSSTFTIEADFVLVDSCLAITSSLSVFVSNLGELRHREDRGRWSISKEHTISSKLMAVAADSRDISNTLL
jgi:hypothetical protein